MTRRNQTLPRIFLLSAIVTGGFSGCSNERPTPRAQTQTVSNVFVFVVKRENVPDALEAIGTVRAAQSSQIASQMMGNIVEIRAQEGDRVQSGQVLAILDDAQPRSAVDQAAAAAISAEKETSAADSEFTLAEATLKRYQQLYEKRSVSPQEFDESKARYQSAEARRDMARAQQTQAKAALTQARTSLGYTRIRAPFAGVVTEKKADSGTLASPGMPLFTIEDTRSYRLEVTVDESDIRLVHAGQVAPVTIDALGNRPIPGKVAQIVPAADAASRSFLVKVELPRDSHLRSGLFGRTQFSRGERPAVLIPRTALVERGQLQGVYVLDANQIAGFRYVTLGKSEGEKVEILSGLQDGEKLVAAPADQELSGKKILVQQ
jgi:membrane fusion protein, multidrug efflux system